MPGPLEGIRIVEFTQIIAAPFGGMLLSDMGAEVIKIEPIGGEPWRLHSEFIPKESKTYMGLNRGKKSLPLDLKNPKSIEIIHKLIEKTDVVIINARPDVPEKLGIDYETFKSINPQIIYCDNTAFGRKGPDRLKPGYDVVVQAMSGLMAADNKVADGTPQQVTATAVADFSTAIAIAWAVSSALFSRERTGKGQMIETSLLATALAIQPAFFEVTDYGHADREEYINNINILRQAQMPYELLLEERQNFIGRGSDFKTYYTTYQTKDQAIAIGCLSNSLREKAAKVIGLEDPRFQPNYDPTNPSNTEKFDSNFLLAKKTIASKPVTFWLEAFDKAGVPAGAVKFVEELFEDPQVLANDNVVTLHHEKAGEVKMFGPILKMSETPLKAQFASPVLGQHTNELLSFLGYSDSQIEEFKQENITE